MPALPIIAVAATVASAAVAADAAYQQGQAQKKAANYNASQQQYNATMEGYNADILKQQGQQDALAIENQGQIIQGKAKAAAAASGLSGGSSLDVQYNDLVVSDENALALKYRGTIGAYNATSQGTLDTAQGGLYSSQASFAGTSGILSAGGALLSGASRVSGQIGNTNPTTPGGIFGSTTTANPPTLNQVYG